jgi:predicted regulator of Ras-like GTPase activity (Roadblock/LC7/MglB family)
MADKKSGWDALFDPEDDLEAGIGGRSHLAGASSAQLEKYLQLPGVRGAIQVTLDGVVLNQDVPGDVQYYSALTASIGSTARQVDRMLTMGGFEYAVVRMTADTHSTMIFRAGDTFVGLLLSGEIAPTHIITRLRDLGSGGLG